MNEIIEKMLKDNEKIMSRVIAIDGPVTAIEHVLENRPHLGGSIYVSHYYGVGIHISVNVDSLKEVPGLLRALSRHGIRIDHNKKITESEVGKTYRLLAPSAQALEDGTDRKEPCTLEVYVRQVGQPACRYVKTGEKVVDVMEWKCDEPVMALGGPPESTETP